MVEKEGFIHFVKETLKGAFGTENLKDVISTVRDAALWVFHFGYYPHDLDRGSQKDAQLDHDHFVQESARIAAKRAVFNEECSQRLNEVLRAHENAIKAKLTIDHMYNIDLKKIFAIGSAYQYCDLKLEHKEDGTLVANIYIPDVSSRPIPMCDLETHLWGIDNTPEAIVKKLEEAIQSYLASGK